MKRNIYLVIGVITITLFNCKTLSLGQESQSNTKHQVLLGSVGTDKSFLLESGFNSSAIPHYTAPIKVSVSKEPFTKSTYRAYQKAKSAQVYDKEQQDKDTLQHVSSYIKVAIADRIALLKALGNAENIAVKDYLGLDASANIITSVSMVLEPQDIEALLEAESVSLIEFQPKNYALELFQGNNEKQIIKFTRAIVFEYRASNCCWQENRRRQLKLVDLVGPYDNCPNKSYRSAQRAIKQTNDFKL